MTTLRQRIWCSARDVVSRGDLRRALRTWGRVAVTVAAAGAVSTSCTKGQLEGESSAYLIVTSLQGASVQAASASSPTFGGVLDSDVCVHTDGGGCGVFDDAGQVTLQLGLKDPGSTTSPNTPTTSNFITVNRYHVDYVRADGHNVQGQDVPYSFDGAITVTVGNAVTSATLTLVRIQAKEEAPLLGLAQTFCGATATTPGFPCLGGSTVAISTIAEVTFYGTDQAGRAVSVTGQIEVNFADWADPASSGGSGSSS